MEDTLLGRIFSGSYDDNLSKDADGCYFLDLNPEAFALVLNYMRDLVHNSCAQLPKPTEPLRKAFKALLKHLTGSRIQRGDLCELIALSSDVPQDSLIDNSLLDVECSTVNNASFRQAVFGMRPAQNAIENT